MRRLKHNINEIFKLSHGSPQGKNESYYCIVRIFYENITRFIVLILLYFALVCLTVYIVIVRSICLHIYKHANSLYALPTADVV